MTRPLPVWTRLACKGCDRCVVLTDVWMTHIGRGRYGKLKARDGMPSVDMGREAAQKVRHEELAIANEIAPNLVSGVFRLIIEEVVREHHLA